MYYGEMVTKVTTAVMVSKILNALLGERFSPPLTTNRAAAAARTIYGHDPDWIVSRL
jgi:hypothetical protein